ncbi:mandelate racemase/muconate lactonizing enzyme family protein [Jiangella ureilytica]|uniref:Mandelate racemase/muconate lactonizing enzyme family protein n=2 Tax=Jiangella ureilytica TaxID=2530374 RepID=A0A4R4RVB9_9ACTN|nr:mandelate racemase/muconate lactonizing enzyme family protein [Jiangella ureilytica]
MHRVATQVPLLEAPVVRKFLLVRIETDSGIVGWGLTAGSQRYVVQNMINNECRELLVGTDPLATERRFDELQAKLNARAQTGAFSSALSAIDIGLWDIKGKDAGRPVWQLLGGYSNTVPAYTTFGLRAYSREQLGEVAKELVGKGHDKLKIRVGEYGNGEAPDEDAARVIAVREAVGDGVQLMLDANYKFKLPHAMRLCQLLEPYGITWLEEPVWGNDPRLLAILRRKTSIPISAGQNEGSLARHRELLMNEAVDILQPNVVHLGGYTEGAKVAALASAWNTPIANGGGWPLYNMHLQGAVANGWRVEFHMDVWNSAPMIYRDPPLPENGVLRLPDAPGLGLEIREDGFQESLETVERHQPAGAR